MLQEYKTIEYFAHEVLRKQRDLFYFFQEVKAIEAYYLPRSNGGGKEAKCEKERSQLIKKIIEMSHKNHRIQRLDDYISAFHDIESEYGFGHLKERIRVLVAVLNHVSNYWNEKFKDSDFWDAVIGGSNNEVGRKGNLTTIVRRLVKQHDNHKENWGKMDNWLKRLQVKAMCKGHVSDALHLQPKDFPTGKNQPSPVMLAPPAQSSSSSSSSSPLNLELLKSFSPNHQSIEVKIPPSWGGAKSHTTNTSGGANIVVGRMGGGHNGGNGPGGSPQGVNMTPQVLVKFQEEKGKQHHGRFRNSPPPLPHTSRSGTTPGPNDNMTKEVGTPLRVFAAPDPGAAPAGCKPQGYTSSPKPGSLPIAIPMPSSLKIGERATLAQKTALSPCAKPATYKSPENVPGSAKTGNTCIPTPFVTPGKAKTPSLIGPRQEFVHVNATLKTLYSHVFQEDWTDSRLDHLQHGTSSNSPGQVLMRSGGSSRKSGANSSIQSLQTSWKSLGRSSSSVIRPSSYSEASSSRRSSTPRSGPLLLKGGNSSSPLSLRNAGSSQPLPSTQLVSPNMFPPKSPDMNVSSNWESSVHAKQKFGGPVGMSSAASSTKGYQSEHSVTASNSSKLLANAPYCSPASSYKPLQGSPANASGLPQLPAPSGISVTSSASAHPTLISSSRRSSVSSSSQTLFNPTAVPKSTTNPTPEYVNVRPSSGASGVVTILPSSVTITSRLSSNGSMSSRRNSPGFSSPTLTINAKSPSFATALIPAPVSSSSSHRSLRSSGASPGTSQKDPASVPLPFLSSSTSGTSLSKASSSGSGSSMRSNSSLQQLQSHLSPQLHINPTNETMNPRSSSVSPQQVNPNTWGVRSRSPAQTFYTAHSSPARSSTTPYTSASSPSVYETSLSTPSGFNTGLSKMPSPNELTKALGPYTSGSVRSERFSPQNSTAPQNPAASSTVVARQPTPTAFAPVQQPPASPQQYQRPVSVQREPTPRGRTPQVASGSALVAASLAPVLSQQSQQAMSVPWSAFSSFRTNVKKIATTIVPGSKLL